VISDGEAGGQAGKKTYPRRGSVRISLQAYERDNSYDEKNATRDKEAANRAMTLLLSSNGSVGVDSVKHETR
jgi:hypothetical protein